MVTVLMVTYNHAAVIRQAIDGVLMQEGVPFRLVVADDASPDGTGKVVEEIVKTHPKGHLIDFVQHEKNIGMMANFMGTVESVKTKYSAICEGDDYWTDPYKLQKQVKFLEENADFSICFHAVQELRGGKLEPSPMNYDGDRTFTDLDLAEKNLMHTPSAVYRTPFETYPDYFATSPAADYVLWMTLATRGKIRYINEVMAVYRIHGGGIWSMQGRVKTLDNWQKVLSLLTRYPFREEVLAILKQQLRNTRTALLEIYQETDPAAFAKRMRQYTSEDHELAHEWLLTHFPDQLRRLKTTRSYRLAQVFSRMAGIVRFTRRAR